MDSDKHGGGVCFYIMWTIANLNRDNLVPDNLESVCLEINQPNSRSFLYRFYYLSPAVSNR
jgi:hypothetical protein